MMTKRQKIKELEKLLEEKNIEIAQLKDKYDYAKKFVPMFRAKVDEFNKPIGREYIIELILKKLAIFQSHNKGHSPKYLFISYDMLDMIVDDKNLLNSGMYFCEIYEMKIICCYNYKNLIEVGGYND